MTKFSIIMATYNSEAFVEKALESFINQTYRGNYEIIVVDGGSKDNTVGILTRYGHKISKWISEPDRGIYDAWNKGIQLSSGEWILFVGSDDTLELEALENYSIFLNQLTEEVDYVSSKNVIVDANGSELRVKGWPWKWPFFLKEMTVAHPGSLHSKRLYERYGYYNTEFKIVGDYEFLLRPRNQLKTAFMDKVTLYMQEGGTSDSLKGVWEAYRASTITGQSSRIEAFINSAYVSAKFLFKKAFRRIGLNVHLK